MPLPVPSAKPSLMSLATLSISDDQDMQSLDQHACTKKTLDLGGKLDILTRTMHLNSQQHDIQILQWAMDNIERAVFYYQISGKEGCPIRSASVTCKALTRFMARKRFAIENSFYVIRDDMDGRRMFVHKLVSNIQRLTGTKPRIHFTASGCELMFKKDAT